MANELVKLLPCPFCGRAAMARFDDLDQTWGVLCRGCDAEMARAAYTEAEATELWNTRTHQDRG